MSPLQIQILLHYYACADDYREGDFSAPAVREGIDWFRTNGYLKNAEPIYNRTYELDVKGYVYVSALMDVPEPVSNWVVNFPKQSPANH